MTPSHKSIYPTDELSRFLAEQAARLNAEAAATPTSGYSRQLRGSVWTANPDGSMNHSQCTHEATNDEEEWCRKHAPLRGLSAEGVMAYERLYGPQDPFRRLLARMNEFIDSALCRVFRFCVPERTREDRKRD
jgi:hypothetical protein